MIKEKYPTRKKIYTDMILDKFKEFVKIYPDFEIIELEKPIFKYNNNDETVEENRCRKNLNYFIEQIVKYYNKGYRTMYFYEITHFVGDVSNGYDENKQISFETNDLFFIRWKFK